MEMVIFIGIIAIIIAARYFDFQREKMWFGHGEPAYRRYILKRDFRRNSFSAIVIPAALIFFVYFSTKADPIFSMLLLLTCIGVEIFLTRTRRNIKKELQKLETDSSK